MRKSMATLVLALILFSPLSASATEPFIGEVRYFGFNFCPRGWLPAAGQLITISENPSLFSLYGTTYGGDGRTNFALPDLRGKVVVGQGQGPGLNAKRMGQTGGVDSLKISIKQKPGEGQEIVPPYLTLNACVAVVGIFPSRN